MRRFTTLLLTMVLIFSLPALTGVAEEKKGQKLDLAKNSSSAIIMERDTGTVIYEKNSHEKLPPASMTKIMTMILIMEALEKGKISLDDKVRASENAASMGGSQIFLEAGEEMTVRELLLGIAVASGNDASVAMAEHISGSVDAFIGEMNEKAKEIGVKNTYFKNTTGLPADGHYSTAYDMALMAKELLKYEDITKFTGIYDDYLRKGSDKEFWLVNTNKLVKFYDGVDGLKTGFTREAKYCLTATAKKNDMRIITVVMGAPTSKERNAQVSQMLDYAFTHYQTHKKYKKNEKIQDVKVSKGNKDKLKVLTSESISILTEKGAKVEGVTEKVKLKKLSVPIKKGDQVGSLILEKDGKVLSKTALVAGDDVKEASFWQLFKRSISGFTKKSN
ncbi:D-alanyl-D-alanine carboxypeptidase [Lottiidibacillus patelloidae]|uniref:serine-type D-Ala-D-Ala carboxypeptidase n=1 Tax=Lottiidibacillus patelloidae TaxID=2670334 RepID=A0A263BTR6_9BACI|nr:D-alanyl-D-alanine carboxypeptidase family protein [Lottiidibacillus patelloidae]OZM57133.1 D-alanyl-D-alanine carboxypeptidase [Lottiidibacillus patelloidae]